jgi:hypothetical protein
MNTNLNTKAPAIGKDGSYARQLTDLGEGTEGRRLLGNVRAQLDEIEARLYALDQSEAVVAMGNAVKAIRNCMNFAIKLAVPAAGLFRDRADEMERARAFASPETIKSYFREQVIIEQAAAVEVQARALAAAVVERMKAADRANQAALALATSPLALAQAASYGVDDWARVAGLRDELQAALPSQIGAWMSGYIDANDEKKELDLALAAGPILDEIDRGETKEIGRRFRIGDDERRRKELDATRSVQRLIRDRRAQKAPKSIEVAAQLYSGPFPYGLHTNLVTIFSVVLGFNGAVITDREYSTWKSTRDSRGHDSLAIQDAWVTRWISATGAVGA